MSGKGKLWSEKLLSYTMFPLFWDKSPETFLLYQHRYLSPSLPLLLIYQA